MDWARLADTTLTLAGFIALASLGLAAIGLALSTATRSSELRERLARFEEILRNHLESHERKG
jgi:hypothetical protein